MPSRTDHFGWPSFYEDPDVYVQAQQEFWAQKAVEEALRILRQRGLLREDRLSYTRICELEHETEIVTGSWTDYLHALHEAELRDRGEVWKTSTI